VLAESVDVRVLGKVSTKSQVLRLEHKLCSGGVEQSGSTTAARNGKREWVVDNFEDKLSRCRNISICTRARED
jgi:hypothetical protein